MRLNRYPEVAWFQLQIGQMPVVGVCLHNHWRLPDSAGSNRKPEKGVLNPASIAECTCRDGSVLCPKIAGGLYFCSATVRHSQFIVRCLDLLLICPLLFV